MAILYKSNNQIQTPPDGGKPISERKLYAPSAAKAAPFLSNWISDPTTVQKMDEQFYKGSADKMSKNITNMPIFDMQKMASLSPIQYSDELTDYNKLPGNSSNKSSNSNMFGIFKAKGAPGMSYRGTSDSGYKGIGTIYDVSNPDEFGTATHEMTHRSGIQDAAEKYIYDKWGSKQIPESKLKGLGFDETENQLGYLRQIGVDKEGVSKEGVYPRIMQLRKALNLTPENKYKVTQKMLNSIDPNDKTSPLRGLRSNWNDATILEILNTVAQNKQKTAQQSNTSWA